MESDYIDRSKAIETPCRIMDETSHDYSAGISVALDAIEAIPTADVRPVVRGKWEEVGIISVDVDDDDEEHAFDMIATMRCSVCDRYHNEVHRYGNPIEMAQYCPNCGAKMEG